MNPHEEDINIIDIAHALSMLCRANGHMTQFFSVGQHSINCAAEAKKRGFSDRIQFACLLHDASEAYISDITRPVKAVLESYREIEKELQKIIYDKFNIKDLSDEEHLKIDICDDVMLSAEFDAMHPHADFETEYKVLSMPDLA
ncbi:MAG: phosphohydrolase, partial [Bacillota bacterium]|nr:phosphohydrolase [Bacillota bacterium]